MGRHIHLLARLKLATKILTSAGVAGVITPKATGEIQMGFNIGRMTRSANICTVNSLRSMADQLEGMLTREAVEDGHLREVREMLDKVKKEQRIEEVKVH